MIICKGLWSFVLITTFLCYYVNKSRKKIMLLAGRKDPEETWLALIRQPAAPSFDPLSSMETARFLVSPNLRFRVLPAHCGVGGFLCFLA
jgi:hypothetical protein